MPGKRLKTELIPSDFHKKKDGEQSAYKDAFSSLLNELSGPMDCDCLKGCFESELIPIETIEGCKSLKELVELYRKLP